MTLAEFKAWFEGYAENIEGAPSAKQWKLIKARVKEIDGEKITERMFIDRYWPTTWPRYDMTPANPSNPFITWCSSDIAIVSDTKFKSTNAMSSLGVHEAMIDAVALS